MMPLPTPTSSKDSVPPTPTHISQQGPSPNPENNNADKNVIPSREGGKKSLVTAVPNRMKNGPARTIFFFEPDADNSDEVKFLHIRAKCWLLIFFFTGVFIAVIKHYSYGLLESFKGKWKHVEVFILVMFCELMVLLLGYFNRVPRFFGSLVKIQLFILVVVTFLHVVDLWYSFYKKIITPEMLEDQPILSDSHYSLVQPHVEIIYISVVLSGFLVYIFTSIVALSYLAFYYGDENEEDKETILAENLENLEIIESPEKITGKKRRQTRKFSYSYAMRHDMHSTSNISKSLDDCETGYGTESQQSSRETRATGGMNTSPNDLQETEGVLPRTFTPTQTPTDEKSREPLIKLDEVDYEMEVFPCRTIGFWLKALTVLGFVIFVGKLLKGIYDTRGGQSDLATRWYMMALYDGIMVFAFIVVYLLRKKLIFKVLTIITLVDALFLTLLIVTLVMAYIRTHDNDDLLEFQWLVLVLIFSFFLRVIREYWLLYYMWKVAFSKS
ncbi:unnamed protein product [Caenorhabditis auriculariae]|uniref:Uncharacterized protein n=1 Tax=Caenorhabditis auriculariae TaxID=2777116 RepID=A0A8S1HJH2_9PELO|nr:unnamed protein product [Caenorhabditis auriculariae]